MKRHWIEYVADSPVCPMTYWVHRELDSESWYEATQFDPPRQPVVPGRGYPIFRIEYDRVEWEFASFAEMSACHDTLSQKLLPRSLDLARQRSPQAGPNRHWLSRLSSDAKPWSYREKFVHYLDRAVGEFKRELGVD